MYICSTKVLTRKTHCNVRNNILTFLYIVKMQLMTQGLLNLIPARYEKIFTLDDARNWCFIKFSSFCIITYTDILQHTFQFISWEAEADNKYILENLLLTFFVFNLHESCLWQNTEIFHKVQSRDWT